MCGDDNHDSRHLGFEEIKKKSDTRLPEEVAFEH